LDYEEGQYRWPSEKTGIPSDVVPEGLSAFDLLFPTRSGWLRSREPYSRVKTMGLMPVPFLGIGANFCRPLFAQDGEYASLRTRGRYTKRDLARWNNNLCEYLQRYGQSVAKRTTEAGKPGPFTETTTGEAGARVGFTVKPETTDSLPWF
jgi:hypothetical protein